MKRTSDLVAAVACGLACLSAAFSHAQVSAQSALAQIALPFDAAILRAAETVLSMGLDELKKTKATLPRPLVIDPLIDASSGQQTVGTQYMGDKLTSFIRARYGASLEVVPFNQANLDRTPILLIGTLTAINAKDDPKQRNDLYRIWLTLIDLSNGQVIGKALARATEESVDATPSPLYRDSPTWAKDTSVGAYIDSCQLDTKLGDRAHPTYLRGLDAAAVITAATSAYESNRLEEANQLYQRAARMASAEDQLRVLNGLYLTHWKLGRTQQAEESFARIVALGLEQKKLGIKFLFHPSTTRFVDDVGIKEQYPLWLRLIARQSSRDNACIRVVGHTSRTGSEPVNDKLSRERASRIQSLLAREDRSLLRRLSATGVGFRENLIGSGTDDARDALDRRVEFNVIACQAQPG